MIHITLTSMEERLCHEIANKRFTANRAQGIVDEKRGFQSNEFTDLNGFGGEMAFCKAMNLYPDFRIIAGGVGLVDAILYDRATTVDVKTSKHPKANLIARKIPDDVDLFVLVIGEMPEYDVVGYATRETILGKPLKDLGYGPTYFVSTDELKPIEELLYYDTK